MRETRVIPSGSLDRQGEFVDVLYSEPGEQRLCQTHSWQRVGHFGIVSITYPTLGHVRRRKARLNRQGELLVFVFRPRPIVLVSMGVVGTRGRRFGKVFVMDPTLQRHVSRGQVCLNRRGELEFVF